MLLFNTLTRQKESFVPLTPGKVGLYACGITTYDYCHIGHGRSAVVFDVLVRYLRSKGLQVTFIRNFTDVDDKIIQRARQERTSSKNMNDQCAKISNRYIQAFHEDMDKLGVLRADIEPKATEHIPSMISLCQTLITGGHAYATSNGDVYFKVRSDPDYGKLSRRSLDEMHAGSRIAPGEEKEDPLDFALWKSAKVDEPSWPSPWGPGRPGWHIECSAMTEEYWKLPLDIHGGGQDLIFPHHENEIAQSECATGKQLARFWVHNGFVQINAEKMSKSLGNFTTLRDFYQSRLPEVLRYFLLTHHYRSPIDFSLSALDEAEKNCKRIYETLAILSELTLAKQINPDLPPAQLRSEFSEMRQSWDRAMEDDLNTAAALGHMNALIRFANRLFDEKNLNNDPAIANLLIELHQDFLIRGRVLGLFTETPEKFLTSLREIQITRKNLDAVYIDQLVSKRQQARNAKDFAQADAIRDELALLGVLVRDTPNGSVWDLI